ncbi:MAG: HD domain-containing protein [Lachnospiraceae bacterium]|nr:HD domain-containing protein [Lachnospiraceae bacterium]
MRLQFSDDRKYMEKYLQEYIEKNGFAQSREALKMAVKLHEGQKRAEGLPYIIHPMMLVMHGIALGLHSDDLTAVMLLHDVCEDCPVTPEELPVNDTIKEAVRCITKDRRDGETKAQAMGRYMENIRKSKEACIVKIFDRCHNVSSMAGTFSEDRMRAYIRETKEYIYPLIQYTKEKYPEYETMIFALEYQITSIIRGLER